MTARENRGTGARLTKCEAAQLLEKFLGQFLANASVSQDTGNKVIPSTIRQSVVSSNTVVKLDGLQPCSHEEADSVSGKGCHEFWIQGRDNKNRCHGCCCSGSCLFPAVLGSI